MTRTTALFQDLLTAAVAALVVAACGSPGSAPAAPAAPPEPPSAPRISRLDPPAGAGAMAPGLAAAPGGAHLVWIEPVAEGGHRLLYSRLEAEAWRPPAEVVRGDGFFANWADTPTVVEDQAGRLYVHWLEKLGVGTYAYGVQLARSEDGGATWERLGLLHDDRSETEHGFVSLVPMGGGVEAVWLDGRGTSEGRPMQLRSARLDGASVAASTLVAESVCDCCPTSLAVAENGPVAAYRGRSAEEIRDIHLARKGRDGWLAPVPVAADGWMIPGCPVNGPAVTADGERVAVAWFTAPNGTSRVQVAWSDDGGATFGEATLLDGEDPIGRVSAALDDASVWVAWVAAGASDAEAEIRLARIGPGGTVDASWSIEETTPSRKAGVPRLVRDGGRLLLAWVEAGDTTSLHLSVVPLRI